MFIYAVITALLPYPLFFRSAHGKANKIKVIGIFSHKYRSVRIVMAGREHSVYVRNQHQFTFKSFAMRRLQPAKIGFKNKHRLPGHIAIMAALRVHLGRPHIIGVRRGDAGRQKSHNLSSLPGG